MSRDDNNREAMNINVTLNLNGPFGQDGMSTILDQLAEIRETLTDLTTTENEIMSTLEETLTAVQDEGTQIDGLVVFTQGLQAQIADALAGITIPPAVQAKVDAVFAAVETNKSKVVAAMNTGSGGAPVPVGDPTVPAPVAG